MKSPFPGMDPYLERHWPDVHSRLVTYAADSLNTELPEELVARTEERVAIESDSELMGLIAPDVRVLEAMERPSESAQTGGLALAAPYRLVALVESATERFIKILDGSERLITVIEFVSPTNKRGKGLEAFREKRAELLLGDVHFVEIDLVRAGDWTALLRPHICPRELVTPYRAIVRLAGEPRIANLYPISIRDRLPRVPVPLRSGDPLVEMDLQSLIEDAYRKGRYERTIDYTQPPALPLTGEDAGWTDELLKAAGKR